MIDYEKYGFTFRYNTWSLPVGERRWLDTFENSNTLNLYWIGRGPLVQHKFYSLEEFEEIIDSYLN